MKTVYFIGTDEAGYGPNLGPLLVSASCWQYQPTNFGPCKTNRPAARSLFDHLPTEEDATAKTPSVESSLEQFDAALEPLCARGGLFPIIDSKKLYHSGEITALERSLLLALDLMAAQRAENGFDSAAVFERVERRTFRTVLRSLVPEERSSGTESPVWETDRNFSIPLAAKNTDESKRSAVAEEIVRRFRESAIALCGLRSRRIQPAEFNRILARTGSKSDLLAEATMRLARDFLDEIRLRTSPNGEPVFALILCDKLGGRNRYADLLRGEFSNSTIQTLGESRNLSRYRWEEKKHLSIEIRFQAKGESNRPTALASIASKYLRELSMTLFNRYWIEKKPDLLPTAGYPVDARRFWSEIAPLAATLGLDRKTLWREK